MTNRPLLATHRRPMKPLRRTLSNLFMFRTAATHPAALRHPWYHPDNLLPVNKRTPNFRARFRRGIRQGGMLVSILNRTRALYAATEQPLRCAGWP